MYHQSEIKVKSVIDSFSTKIGEYEKRSENALEVLHSTLLKEQQRLNDSLQATVDNIQTETESKVKSMIDSISIKMNEFSKYHSKGENALELLQSDFLQDQDRFNQSLYVMANDIKQDLNKTIQNLISVLSDGRECKDIADAEPGIYTVSPDKPHIFKVRCEDKNWTVIQKRFDGSTEFYRNWDDYENGFGNLNGEFWLGNRNIALLTSVGTHELRINIEDWNGNKRYANFKNFKIDGASDKYRLHISGYSGDAGDGMTEYNDSYFSTYDRDHDTHSGNCADYKLFKGAWWFTYCWSGGGASLNGKYTSGPSCNAGIIYRTWKSKSLKKSTMMIRKV
ncbi:fibrinogen-like protein 1 [Mytilus galloprovincialis]|uniref:fibrinogen-like protein 1 n=1 Tax=Mytilus galloprovincialis TaxID=29158 RepID=UPI003F7CCC18